MMECIGFRWVYSDKKDWIQGCGFQDLGFRGFGRASL